MEAASSRSAGGEHEPPTGGTGESTLSAGALDARVVWQPLSPPRVVHLPARLLLVSPVRVVYREPRPAGTAAAQAPGDIT